MLLICQVRKYQHLNNKEFIPPKNVCSDQNKNKHVFLMVFDGVWSLPVQGPLRGESDQLRTLDYIMCLQRGLGRSWTHSAKRLSPAALVVVSGLVRLLVRGSEHVGFLQGLPVRLPVTSHELNVCSRGTSRAQTLGRRKASSFNRLRPPRAPHTFKKVSKIPQNPNQNGKLLKS